MDQQDNYQYDFNSQQGNFNNQSPEVIINRQ
jgi:hypothetical protein